MIWERFSLRQVIRPALVILVTYWSLTLHRGPAATAPAAKPVTTERTAPPPMPVQDEGRDSVTETAQPRRQPKTPATGLTSRPATPGRSPADTVTTQTPVKSTP